MFRADSSASRFTRNALSVVHMYEPLILVLLCQRSQIAVDLVCVATIGPHLNRQMFDAKIGADFGANGVK